MPHWCPPAGVCAPCGADAAREARRRASGPLNPDEVRELADYNAERSRGIAHTHEWVERMAVLQQRFDNVNVFILSSAPRRRWWRR